MPPRLTGLPTLRLLLARVHLRLILFAVVLATACMMLSGSLVIRTYVKSNLVLAADIVSYSVEPAVVFEDRQAIAEAIGAVAGYPSLDKVEVRDPAGNLLAEWSRPHGALRGWLVDSANSLIWPTPVRAPIAHSGERIGEVLVYGNSGGILRFLLVALVISLSCIALTVIATRILARHLQQGVVGPLEQVARIARDVREQRAFEKRVPAAGIAEIDRFGQDFNALLAELQGWHDGLTSENAELMRRATHDELTGLGNRAAFDRRLGDAVARATAHGEPFALIYLDVDRFKQVNDEYGHISGDVALIAVGERLRAAVRVSDAAFRLGGDEFAVLLDPVEELSHVDAVVERIRSTVSSPFRMPSGAMASSSVSIGVALFPRDGQSAEELLGHADSAMYAEKKRRKGGNNGGAHEDY